MVKEGFVLFLSGVQLIMGSVLGGLHLRHQEMGVQITSISNPCR